MTNSISSFLWINIVIPNFKSHNISIYFMKRLQRCVYNVSARWTVKTDKFTLFVFYNFLVLLSTTVCSQKINKQNVNIADETLTDYSFLGRYHYTKSKNYLKRRYRIRHWIPMFFGTLCINVFQLTLYYKNGISDSQQCTLYLYLGKKYENIQLSKIW